jgi:hypothetical protein
MAYKFIIQENPDHIRVEVSGEWDPDKNLIDAKSVLMNVTDACRKKGINHILAIWDVPGHISTLTGYQIVEMAKEIHWDLRFKLSVVFAYNERFMDALFVETVAVNRGFMVKMFKHEEEAKSWLLESPKSK